MKAYKISDQAIAALERVGLASVINDIGDLLDSADGEDRHGSRGWEEKSEVELMAKKLGHASQHLAGSFVDEASGHLTIVHSAVRGLMIAEKFVRVQRRIRRG